jgi:beta-barrel assembly-enhancing protease
MKRIQWRIQWIAALCLGAAVAASGQFGGILNKAKEKIDRAQQKTAPVTDRAQKAADTFQSWTPEEEQAIGDLTSTKMVAMFGVIDDPGAVKYVNLVGQTVAQFASRALPYRFGILDTEIVGAFALPGGYIFITRGSLEGMTSEAQLAGALGHEIVHTADRHLESEIRSKKTSAWAIQEAASATDRSRQALQLKADAYLKDLFNTSLSRSKEDSADEAGAAMAAKAGYAASGLLDFLKVLATVNSKPENARYFGQLLSTHPSFEDRIAHLTPFVEKSGRGKTLEARFRAALPKK